MSKKKLISTRTVEKPGISPAVLFYLVGDTVFARLEDVERDLPPYTEHVRLLPLDRESGQEEEYRRLATRMHAEVQAALAAGSKRLLGAYLQSLLSYPDACHRGEVVLDRKTGRVLAEAAALDAGRLYPKERDLVELCRRERARGRPVLVYASHTGERDITARLEGMPREAGLRVRVLKASVKAESREDWVSARVSEGLDVLITNPRCVETGLDLISFPTLVFYETEYSVFTLWQAAKRSWRIGQTRPVEVHYWAYEHTLQADALSLIASKLRWSLMIEGDLGDEGLGGMGADGEDVMTALARRFAEQEGVVAESVEALFAESRSACTEEAEYLDDGWCDEDLPESPQLSVVGSTDMTPEPTPEELASL